MARNQDYVPCPFAEFDVWFNNLVSYVVDRVENVAPPDKWTHIPAANMDE